MLGDQNHVARICGVSDSLQRNIKKPLVQPVRLSFRCANGSCATFQKAITYCPLIDNAKRLGRDSKSFNVILMFSFLERTDSRVLARLRSCCHFDFTHQHHLQSCLAIYRLRQTCRTRLCVKCTFRCFNAPADMRRVKTNRVFSLNYVAELPKMSTAMA